jgi:hypothetical protein
VTGPPSGAAFYCVASSKYFLGAVGLVNSLRLHGHGEPIYLLDCGLTDDQRRCLDGEVTVVAAPSSEPPFMLKAVAPLRHPAEVAVLLDADMVVNRSLSPLVEAAAVGRVLAPSLPMERHFEDWGQRLDLAGAVAERHPYVTSGLVILGGRHGREVLELIHSGRERVDLDRTFLASDETDYPFHYADQDLLNAILAARVPSDRIEIMDGRLVATIPFEGLRVDGGDLPRCRYEDGTEPYVIHHVLPVKPWLEPTPEGAYSRLLRRSLAGADVAVRLPSDQLPLRFRRGPIAVAERRRIGTVAWLRARIPERAR